MFLVWLTACLFAGFALICCDLWLNFGSGLLGWRWFPDKRLLRFVLFDVVLAGLGIIVVWLSRRVLIVLVNSLFFIYLMVVFGGSVLIIGWMWWLLLSLVVFFVMDCWLVFGMFTERGFV